MLASFPASTVNQKQADLGIQNRFNLTPSRFSAFLCVLVDRNRDGLDVLIAVAFTRRPLEQLGERVDPPTVQHSVGTTGKLFP